MYQHKPVTIALIISPQITPHKRSIEIELGKVSALDHRYHRSIKIFHINPRSNPLMFIFSYFTNNYLSQFLGKYSEPNFCMYMFTAALTHCSTQHYTKTMDPGSRYQYSTILPVQENWKPNVGLLFQVYHPTSLESLLERFHAAHACYS